MMKKLKYYAINCLLSGLIGAIVEAAAVIFKKPPYTVSLYSLLDSTIEGAFIGTVCLVAVWELFVRLKRWPVLGFIINFLIIAVLTQTEAIRMGIHSCAAYVNSRWFVVLIVAETLGFILAYLWYRQFATYNQRLAMKKTYSNEDK